MYLISYIRLVQPAPRFNLGIGCVDLPTGNTETLARPLYQQVVEIMTRRIAEGHWKSGEMLPSEPKLAEELGVSPGTVRKALDRLAAENLVTRRQGLGTSVAISTREGMLYRFFKLIDGSGKRFMPDCRQLSKKVVKANARSRGMFGLAKEARVARFLRLRTADELPIMIETVTLPLPLFNGVDKLEEPLPTTLYDFFESEFELKVLRVDERLSAENATAEDAEHLGVDAGAALLVIERTAFTFNDQAIEHRQSRLSTANHAYLSELT